MKVAIVHDDLVQWGGAEKVLLAISEMFPEAPIYTSIYRPSNKLIKQYFGSKDIRTSFLQKLPAFKWLYRGQLPLYSLAFEQFDFSQYDLVISQTTRFAKAIITKPATLHLSYCHTPPRFLWHLSGELGLAKWLDPMLSMLRLHDQIVSSRVDYWLAGSFNAQRRLAKFYRVDSTVLQPFVDDQLLAYPLPSTGDYFLVISRLNRYKNIELVVKTFNQLGWPLVIVGHGPQQDQLIHQAGSNIQFKSNLTDQELRKILAGAKAVIVAAEEDFGMVAIEAQSMGKPVIAFSQGGSVETVIEAKTGLFFHELSRENLISTLQRFNTINWQPAKIRQHAKQFSRQKWQIKFQKLLNSVVTSYTINR